MSRFELYAKLAADEEEERQEDRRALGESIKASE